MERASLVRVDETTYRVGDVAFMTDWNADRPGTERPSADRLRVMKPPRLVEHYAGFLEDHRSDRVVEVGVHDGGSTALLALLGQVDKLVAIELDEEPPEALVSFIEAQGLGDVVRLHFGTDQGDRARLRAIVDDEFGGRPIDLVIDDASHFLGPTTACFECLFPAVAPGGVYVVEDWSWQLRLGQALSPEADGAADGSGPEALLADPESPGTIAFERRVLEAMQDPTPEQAAQFEAGFQAALRDTSESELHERSQQARQSGRLAHRPSDDPLLAFVVSVIRTVGVSDEVIADVHVDPEWVSITRGPAELDPHTFRLDDLVTDPGGWLAAPPGPGADVDPTADRGAARA